MSLALRVVLAAGFPALIMFVVDRMGWSGGFFPWYYILPIAILAPWLIILRFSGDPPGHRILLMDGIAIVLAGVRIVGPYVPPSGHILFAVYTGLTVRNVWYRLGATAIVLQAMWLKVFVWDQAWSALAGVAMGWLLAAGTRGAKETTEAAAPAG